jgi:zinc transporter, ZIP family
VDWSSPILPGFVGSLVAGLGTGVGALPIFVRSGWSRNAQRLMLALAGGMMLGATFFSLLLPALAQVGARGGSDLDAVTTVGLGVVLGAIVLWAVHATIPHQHFTKGREGASVFHLGRNAMFVLAIALHNFPEGLSVGVAYAAGAGTTGLAVMTGIAAQNLPEGLAVAAALLAGGMSRRRAFTIALLTGLVEPMGGLVGAAAVSLSEALLPLGLAFAAGAMLFVVSGEVLPETHVEGGERSATFAVIVGFVAMMALAVLLG